jgi:hypothetical protein
LPTTISVSATEFENSEKIAMPLRTSS